MRRRVERRILKRIRRLRRRDPAFVVRFAQAQRHGACTLTALHGILEAGDPHWHRQSASELLAIVDARAATDALLDLLFRQSCEDELFQTALAIERLSARHAIAPLAHALLHDANPHRRTAAARALGWIRRPTGTGIRALAACVVDEAQPLAAREQAAESLAYVGRRDTLDALIAVLHHPDVRLRFWAVFGLGQSCRGDARALQALEGCLTDEGEPPGNWWPVGREALAMLAGHDERHRVALATEIRRIQATPDALPAERAWAADYDHFVD